MTNFEAFCWNFSSSANSQIVRKGFSILQKTKISCHASFIKQKKKSCMLLLLVSKCLFLLVDLFVFMEFWFWPIILNDLDNKKKVFLQHCGDFWMVCLLYKIGGVWLLYVSHVYFEALLSEKKPNKNTKLCPLLTFSEIF